MITKQLSLNIGGQKIPKFFFSDFFLNIIITMSFIECHFKFHKGSKNAKSMEKINIYAFSSISVSTFRHHTSCPNNEFFKK